MKVFQLMGTHPRVLLVNQLQNREEKLYWVSTVFTLSSRNEGPKLRHLQEDQDNKGPLQKTQWRSRTSSRKMLVTWQQQITKFPVKDVNLETTIDTLSWYKIWQLNGFNLIRSKPNFSGNRKDLTKDLGADEETKSHLHRQFPGIWQTLWRFILESIVVRQHRSETNGIAERAVRRIKEGSFAVLLQSGLNEKGWADSMECYCYLRNIQDLLSDGKTPYERWFGEPLKGPVIPFGSWQNITLFLLKICHDCISSAICVARGVLRRTQEAYINLAQKSCQVYSLDVHCTRSESGKETSWSQTLRNWNR